MVHTSRAKLSKDRIVMLRNVTCTTMIFSNCKIELYHRARPVLECREFYYSAVKLLIYFGRVVKKETLRILLERIICINRTRQRAD